MQPSTTILANLEECHPISISVKSFENWSFSLQKISFKRFLFLFMADILFIRVKLFYLFW